MIKPERMTRIAIVGSRKKLGVTIQSLYELNLFHIVDYLEDEPGVNMGNPLPQAAEISQRLLRLRSIVRALRLEGYKTDHKVSVDEIEQTSDQAIVTLELEVNKKAEGRQALSSRIRELTVQNESLLVFAEMGLPLSSYSDSPSLSFFSGTAPQPVADKIRSLGVETETVEVPYGKGYAYSVFCRRRDADAVQQALNSAGCQEVKPPLKSGTANEHIASNGKEIEKLQATLSREEEEIEVLREKYASLVLAAEEHYSIEIQKAEAPLRVATTQNSFTIDGWVPVSSLEVIKAAVAEGAGGSVTVEPLAVSKKEEDEQAPVKLKNPRIARPFELFIELMSTPLYREVDPTLPVFIVFPLFFGLMIGDFGYGSCLMLAGLVMYFKLGKESEGWRRLGYIVFAGGLLASIFGLLLFCEAFGLPFHSTPKYPLSWEMTLGINIPLEAHLEKLIAVGDFLALSVLFAWIHLTFGLILGFVNERRHDMKQAAMKILWLMILQGICFQVILIGAGMGNLIAIFMMNTVGAPFAAMTIPFSAIEISVLSLSLIAIGAVGFVVLHGKSAGMELLEILSLFTNVISYARIAAIGVAKGATAYAFNSIVAVNFMGGEIWIAIIGVVVLVLLQLIVFALGSLSAGIQAIRLNYVEFFLKFYKGGGVSFEPLGYKRKHSMKSEV
jgi:V/A-type H+-transporting ATPase subunit I